MRAIHSYAGVVSSVITPIVSVGVIVPDPLVKAMSTYLSSTLYSGGCSKIRNKSKDLLLRVILGLPKVPTYMDLVGSYEVDRYGLSSATTRSIKTLKAILGKEGLVVGSSISLPLSNYEGEASKHLALSVAYLYSSVIRQDYVERFNLRTGLSIPISGVLSDEDCSKLYKLRLLHPELSRVLCSNRVYQFMQGNGLSVVPSWMI